MYPKHSTLLPLRYVAQEIREITELAVAAGVAIQPLTPSVREIDVLRTFQAADIVYLACHGIQDPDAPHESHFCLSTGNVAVSALMGVDLQDAFLAFFSACETARGDRRHADEAVHLAAAMIFAGYRSVVATMWAMSDQDGPYVAKHFYEQLFAAETVDADAVPYALDSAMAALRASGAPPERWATFVHMGA